jgi:hypothetical protein
MTFDLLLLAVAITLNPLPLTPFILILSAPRGGITRAAAFVAAWLVSLIAITAITLALTGGKPPREHTAPSNLGLVVRIVVGAWLLVFAWGRQHARGRPRPAPRWMARLDRLSPLSAAGLGFLLQPWGMIVAAAATISQANLDQWSTYLTVAAFCLVATSSYLVMLGCAIRAPEATRVRLDALRAWIDAHTDIVVIALSVAVGLWLVGNSAYLLAS